MVIKHEVEGYDTFCEYMTKFDNTEDDVYVFFSGSKLPSGESWCDDCVTAYPHVEKAQELLKPTTNFVVVYVGDRDSYKDPKCPFRQDPKLRVLQIPAILKWGKPQRLDGDQCEKDELLELLFTCEDD